MKKMNKWAVGQIRERGGIPCMSTTAFYKIGEFHVAVSEMVNWGKDQTMIIVVYETSMGCWLVTNKEDKEKTMKILDALANPVQLKDCGGLGLDEILEAAKELIECPPKNS